MTRNRPTIEELWHGLRRPALVAGLAMVIAVPVAAQSDDPDSIDEARTQREKAQSEAAEVAAELELLAAEDDEVLAALQAMQAAVAFQQAKVDAARADIVNARIQLRQREAEERRTEAAIAHLEAQAAILAVDSYVGRADPSELWLSAHDIGAAARESAYLALASGEVSDVADELEQLRSEREAATLAADELRDELVTLEVELADHLAVLEERKAVQEEIRIELQGRIEVVEARQDALEAESAALTEWIRTETARQSALLTTPSSAGFVMPTAGGIGSGFGPRLHPILGYARMHSGVDMGGPTGQTIVSSNSGRILYAGWRGGYGNAVIIDHGGGVTSLYAHMSAIDASTGQSVGRGERIGAVGSTGLSTGPHLHFEIRVNGEPVDPLRYLP
ncbi:MAG: peptidoglycan DD-metalloendopeptidase family protein [Acidimicrobiia bacterium]|nr:peptidoglycan DD-metalloendopeptidase family protein [Acidimicrobiia bacterium]